MSIIRNTSDDKYNSRYEMLSFPFTVAPKLPPQKTNFAYPDKAVHFYYRFLNRLVLLRSIPFTARFCVCFIPSSPMNVKSRSNHGLGGGMLWIGTQRCNPVNVRKKIGRIMF